MPRLILVVAASLTSSLSGAIVRGASLRVDEDLRLADVPAHREGDHAGNEPDHEHAAPADRRQQQRRHQRRGAARRPASRAPT